MSSACDSSHEVDPVNTALEALLAALPKQSSTAEPERPSPSMAVKSKPLPYGLTAICIPRGPTQNEEIGIRAQLGLPPRDRQQRRTTQEKIT